MPPATSRYCGPVAELGGVGPARARALADHGIQTCLDLLTVLPLRYRELPAPSSLRDRPAGVPLAFIGSVRRRRVGRLRRRRGGFADLLLVGEGAAEGEEVRARFYNQSWLARRVELGDRLFVSGRFSGEGRSLHFVADHHVRLAAEDTGDAVRQRLLPVRPRIPGISPGVMGQLCRAALDDAHDEPDPLPEATRAALGLPGLDASLRTLHFPEDREALLAAGERVLFDRFLALFLPLARRAASSEGPGPEPMATPEVDELEALFPFRFTSGQREALHTLLEELRGGRPMRRLLQGDVGAGKTAVVLSVMAATVRAGRQALLLAPSEPLAWQHLQSARAQLEPAGVRIGWLAGGLRASERRELLARLEDGSIDLLVATHAVLGERVSFDRLELVVIDEQHRFGVRQRLRARNKGRAPHMLTLSATPIPRTLCLALMGDLDHLVISDRPEGRAPVHTVVGDREAAFAAVRREVAAGRRAFVVFPSIEGETMPALLAHGERLVAAGGPLAGLSHAFLHGRQGAEERDASMRAFRAGDAAVLLATVMVEVGIDVPEATVMVIAGAERFGLATLHQLRGRVGRGAWPGECHLLPTRGRDGGVRPEVLERLRRLEQEQDGFAIAEADLELRGPGELVGVRQAGPGGRLPLPGGRDRELFEAAHELARAVAAGKVEPLRDVDYYDQLAGSLQRLPGSPLDAV